jgi:hypothetical protein
VKAKPSIARCRHCSQALAASILRCPSCGAETLDEATRRRIEELMEELGRELGASPYLRGSSDLSYTLRGHTWGFLEDADHPVGGAIQQALQRLERLGGAQSSRFVLYHAIHRALRPRYPELAQAVLHLSRRREKLSPES